MSTRQRACSPQRMAMLFAGGLVHALVPCYTHACMHTYALRAHHACPPPPMTVPCREMKGKRALGPSNPAQKEAAADGVHPNQGLIEMFKTLAEYTFSHQVSPSLWVGGGGGGAVFVCVDGRGWIGVASDRSGLFPHTGHWKPDHTRTYTLSHPFFATCPCTCTGGRG